MPPDHVQLFRLLWNPDDIDEVSGVLKPSAFPSGQLDGRSSAYVSVDRADMSRREVMEAIAKEQQSKADGFNHKRFAPMIGKMLCREVREILLDGRQALDVRPYPTRATEALPANDAHCGIENVFGKIGRGAVTQLRNKLSNLVSAPMTFEETYGNDY